MNEVPHSFRFYLECLFGGSGICAASWWIQFVSDMSVVLMFVAQFCGAAIAVYGLWQVIKKARSGEKDK